MHNMIRTYITLDVAEDDLRSVRRYGGILKERINSLLNWFSDSSVSLPLSDSSFRDHPADDVIKGFRGLNAFPVDSIWCDSNHPFGSLRALYCCISKKTHFIGLDEVRDAFSFVDEELERHAMVFGLDQWQDFDEIVFIPFLCRNYHTGPYFYNRHRVYSIDDPYAAASGPSSGFTTYQGLTAAGFSIKDPTVGPDDWEGLFTANRQLKREYHIGDSVDIEAMVDAFEL